MLYITKDNHTGYQTIGPFPIRNIPSSGAYVKNGSSTADDWMSIPRDTLRLHIDDPEKGYVISCNNRPATNHFKNGIYDSGWQYTARADQI
jgi:penicillin amidase